MEQAARRVAARLRGAGHIAWFAGGCVRDALRGVEPADYDIATDAAPAQVEALFPRTVAVGAKFGVVCVLEGPWQFQVAAFRADGVYLDGRHPEGVTAASPETDAQRRDFTVNGMFLDPAADRVIDYVGGRADLEAGVLRAIGDPAARFHEDRLRLLRAVRFATTLGFSIDPATWEAVRTESRELAGVSAERIREELSRTLAHPARVRGFDLLDEAGLLRSVLPEVEALKGCEQPPQFHPEGDVFVHTRRMLELLEPDASLRLVFAVLLHDIGKPPTSTVDSDGRIRFNGHDRVGARMAERVLGRLRFSRAETDAIVAMVENHMHFKDVQRMRVAKVKRLMARPTYTEELELHRVDCASSHGLLDNHAFLVAKAAEFASEPLIPPPLLTGSDLLARGWKPGRALGGVLEALQNLQLEGRLRNRDEALAWVDAECPPPGPGAA
jgi:tRNA nucleotidyltransferase/poly(A) polymerase